MLLSCLLLYSGILILEILDDHICENSWYQLIKHLQLCDDILSIDFEIKDRPQVLYDLLAVVMAIHSLINLFDLITIVLQQLSCRLSLWLVGILKQREEFLLEVLWILDHLIREFT